MEKQHSEEFLIDGDKLYKAVNTKNLRTTKFVSEVSIAEGFNDAEAIDVKEIATELGDAVNSYNFQVFYIDSRARYVFITRDKVNFEAFDSKSGIYKDGCIVYGRLYDLKYKKFLFDHRDATTDANGDNTFVIYDSQVPHIVFNDEKQFYIIGYVEKKSQKMYYVDSCNILECMSYTAFTGDMAIRKRIIFYTSPNSNRDTKNPDYEVRSMIVLDNQLELTLMEYKRKFVKPVFKYSEAESCETVFNLLYYKPDVKKEYPSYVKSKIKVYHLFGDDLISIMVQNRAKLKYSYAKPMYGVVMFKHNSKIFYHEGLGYFENYIYNPDGETCDPVSDHLIIKMFIPRNDFENYNMYLDATDDVVVTDNDAFIN